MKREIPCKCVIIGDDSLSTLCAEYLLTRGHFVISFISQSRQNKHWAKQKKIPWFADANCFLKSAYSGQSFEYLFSIVHLKILPLQLLALPSKFAINYHDSFLPKYAGLHATSWALFNGEKEHGVSWHLMTKKVDAGRLLLQDCISVEKKETAFTLNLKCHQQALITFEKLINLLVTNQFTLKQQDLSRRTYFGRNPTLPRGGVINWRTAGENIDRLCRALEFGEQQTNTLGTAKFILNNKLYSILSHELVPSSGENPGVISEINEQFIQIATQSQDIRLLTIKNDEGNNIPISEVAEQHHLKKGIQLTDYDDTYFAATEKHRAHVAFYEDFWVKRFREVRPLPIPFLHYEKKENDSSIAKTQHYSILSELIKELIKSYRNFAQGNQIILSAFLAYFYRLNNYESFSIALAHPDLRKTDQSINFVAEWVPFTLDLHPEDEFRDILHAVNKQYEIITQNKSYQNDLFSRYPDIEKINLPIALVFTNTEHYQKITNSLIDLVINTKTNRVKIYFSVNLKTIIDQFISHFANFLSSLCADVNRPIKHHALLTETQQREIIVFNWNQTGIIDIKDMNVSTLFEKHAVLIPNKIALIHEGKALTYSELNNKANQLAHYIHQILGKKNTHISIYLPRSIEAIICMLAVLKSGNIYVPISAEAPLEQLQEIVTDCDAKIVLTDSYLGNQVVVIAKPTIKLIKLDSEWDVIRTKSTNNLTDNLVSDQIAYVLYTSGSTGVPKGVQITRRSLTNCLLAMQREIDFNQDDILLAITPITFDISGLENILTSYSRSMFCFSKL